MEEVTGYVFRNILNKHFGFVDKYFTPFVTPNQNNYLKTKDGRELLPEHNEGLNVVIQILTNNVQHFHEFVDFAISLGYTQFNLNFGCPSNTVVKKNKGSGILSDVDFMDRFLDGVFSRDDIGVSVKTRIGIHDAEDIDEILKVYNRYPLSELIVHPRIQKQYYNGIPDLEAFTYFYENAKMPVCYNGDIFSVDDYKNITNRFPNLSSVMIGRGAVTCPGIFSDICNEVPCETMNGLRSFHNDLKDYYVEEYGSHNALFKMKEFWSYFIKNPLFVNADMKKIRKANSITDYDIAIREILR